MAASECRDASGSTTRSGEMFMSDRRYCMRLTIAALALGAVTPVRAADHLDAPQLRAPGVGDRDINDVYVFQSPVNPSNSVLVLTVNPFSGMVNPNGTMSGTTFGSSVEYQVLVDNNGDALPDVTYNTTFSAPVAGSQSLTMTRTANSATTPFATGATESNIALPGSGMLRAGLFDDPFFFDLVGFNNGFNFTGADTFAGADISAIVLEVPSSDLGAQNVGIWARTLVGGVQIDRMGRPAINTALIPSSMKDAFNAGMPSTDAANFSDEFLASITALSNPANAAALTPALLPDVLAFDTSNAGGFLNGRRLADDVIDAELNLLSAGAITGDGVNGNNVPFLGAFPYLAPPNAIPEPATLGLLVLGLLTAGNRARRRAARQSSVRAADRAAHF
jgi:Domain of unknown function (DUF4331)/PEP-CTERM motif